VPGHPNEAASYRQAGIDYEVLDAAKRFAAGEAARTVEALAEADWWGVEASRGNTAYVFERDGARLATVLECLGTKSVLAREIEEQTGFNGFEAIGYDAVAAIVNDLICVGALPLVVNAYFASGGPSWFAEGERLRRLATGWRRACEDSGAIWAGGESPSLPGLVDDRHIEIAGSGVGVIRDQPVLGDELAPGDECVLVESSGLHTNGASLARLLASQAPEGYHATLPSGAPLGQALLTPSYIYVALVRALIEASLPLTFLSHITGHGLRKVMRAKLEVTYRLTALPPVPEVLVHLVEAGGMDPREAYGTLNMGVGLAIFVRAGHGARAAELAEQAGFGAVLAGEVEEGPRRVVLEPVDVEFASGELALP
jgi:phosphoribosylformylglycinamidine cyclo-ligase